MDYWPLEILAGNNYRTNNKNGKEPPAQTFKAADFFPVVLAKKKERKTKSVMLERDSVVIVVMSKKIKT